MVMWNMVAFFLFFLNGILSNYLYLSFLAIFSMLKFSSEFFISIITVFLSPAFLFGCIYPFYNFTSFTFCSCCFLT